MKNLPVLLALSASLLASACAPAPQSPPAPTPTADPVAPSEAPSLSANEPIAGAAYVASPNAGPALDEYPPAPVRAVASSPIDLRSLTEPPLLVVDALGHTSKIKSLDYTSDGRLLVSAGYDKTIRVWSATTGELVRTIRGDIGEGPAGRIYATALSARDELLAVGGWLGKSAQPSAGASDAAYQIRIVDFYSGTTLRLLSGHSDVVTSLAFSHTGARLVSGGGDGQARIWDARKQGSELTLSGHSGIVSAVAWSNDDRLVATAGNDRQVRIWDATNGALISTRSGHEGTVTALGFTPDGRRLLSAGADRTLRSWELLGSQTGGTLARLASGIGSLAISADGQSVVVTPTEAPFESRVLKVADGRVAARFAGQDNVVLASAISPNGKWVATAGGGDHGLAIWNIQTGRSELSTRGHGSAVWSVAFGSDGRSFSFGHRYAPPAGAPYQINGPLEERFVFEPGRLELDVVPDGAYVGDARAREAAGDLVLRTPSGHEDAMLEIWERGSRKAAIGRDSTSGYSHLSFTLSETADLVVSGGENGTLASYDAKTGAKRRDFTGHTGDVLAVALSRDGRRLVSGSSDQTVRLWDVATGRPLLTLFHARNHEWVAFTGAGYFASSAYGEGYLGWHVNRGADRTAAFFSATGLEQQLRFDAVVFEYLINSGDVREAVRRANLLRPAGLAAIPFYRFEDLPQFAPPEIYHMNPGLDLEVNKDRILLEAEAASPSAEPVTAIEILVNGRPLDERWLAHAGQPQIEIQGRYAKIRATLPLPEPNNRISVVARSRFSEGPPAYLNVKRKGGPGELERLYRPNLLVLSVGISKYRGTELQSGSYAERDATALADAFKAQNKNLYGQVKTRVLKDAAASRTAINEGLAWVAQEAKQGDVVIVYLSGHAARDVSGEYHFLPEDGDRQQLSATALSWTALKKALDASPAKVIVLADTCHAGAVGGAAPVDLSWALRENEASDGTIVFTAAAGSEMSYQNEKWGHGAFASALLDGLSGRADYDGDKKVFVRELQYFVGARVAELTAGKQHPTLHLPSSVPNFALAELRATQTSSPKAKP